MHRRTTRCDVEQEKIGNSDYLKSSGRGVLRRTSIVHYCCWGIARVPGLPVYGFTLPFVDQLLLKLLSGDERLCGAT